MHASCTDGERDGEEREDEGVLVVKWNPERRIEDDATQSGIEGGGQTATSAQPQKGIDQDRKQGVEDRGVEDVRLPRDAESEEEPGLEKRRRKGIGGREIAERNLPAQIRQPPSNTTEWSRGMKPRGP